MDNSIKRITTKEGINVVLNNNSAVNSVNLSVYVHTGSIYEDIENGEHGISHFLEHMMFKGTHVMKDAKRINTRLDSLGCKYNAYTDKNHTQYFIKAMSDYTMDILHIMGDLIVNSRFDENDVLLEKNVILEELKMYKDNPDNYLNETHLLNTLKNIYGFNIVGTEESIFNMTSELLKKYHKETYTKDNILIVISGNIYNKSFNTKDILSVIDAYFGTLRSKGRIKPVIPFEFYTGNIIEQRKLEQVLMEINYKGVSYKNEIDFIILNIIHGILGQTMSSRLFQVLREENGLAYSVGTYSSYFETGGVFSGYMACSKETYKDALKLFYTEIDKLSKDGVTKQEISKAKIQLLSSLSYRNETMAGQAASIAKTWLEFRENWDLNKYIQMIESVSEDEINKFIFEKMDLKNKNVMILGDLPEYE